MWPEHTEQTESWHVMKSVVQQKGDMTWLWVGDREDKERAISGIKTNRVC